MSAENKALVARWFDEVWNRGRREAIDEMFAPDGKAYGLGEGMRGPEGFKAFHAQFRGAFPDVRVEVDDMIAEGDQVAYRFTATATHTGARSALRRRTGRHASPAWAWCASQAGRSRKAGTSWISSAC